MSKISEVSATYNHEDEEWVVEVAGDPSTILGLYQYVTQAVAKQCEVSCENLLIAMLKQVNTAPKLDDIADTKYHISIPRLYDGN